MKQCLFLIYTLAFFIIILGIIFVIQDNKTELFVVGWNDPNNSYKIPTQPAPVIPVASPINIPSIEYISGTIPTANIYNLDTVNVQSKSPIGTSDSSSSKYSYNNLDIQYHDTAEDIQKQLGIDPSANLISVLDSSGNLVKIPISDTMNDTTYYDGKMRYDPSNYVPTYEDTIYFSKLTGLGYQTPIYGTDSQFGGFCSFNKNFPDKIEEKCGKLDNDTCATTSCCVLLGGTKCVAGDQNGPTNKTNYSNRDIRRRDKYFFGGKCYGNCVDDQNSYYNYNNEILTKNDKETHKLQLKTSPYDQNYNFVPGPGPSPSPSTIYGPNPV